MVIAHCSKFCFSLLLQLSSLIYDREEWNIISSIFSIFETIPDNFTMNKHTHTRRKSAQLLKHFLNERGNSTKNNNRNWPKREHDWKKNESALPHTHTDSLTHSIKKWQNKMMKLHFKSGVRQTGYNAGPICWFRNMIRR